MTLFVKSITHIALKTSNERLCIHGCYTAILYRMYTRLGIQDEQPLKYLDTKFGKHPLQNGHVVITYTVYSNFFSATCVIFLNNVTNVPYFINVDHLSGSLS